MVSIPISERLLLAYGEVDFEDNRINSADWPAMKESERANIF